MVEVTDAVSCLVLVSVNTAIQFDWKCIIPNDYI